MPKCDILSSSIENILVKTKSKKSNKKGSPSHCNVDCCVPEKTLDCCSLPFQRLDKLRGLWALLASVGTLNGNGINLLPTCASINTNGINYNLEDVNTRGGSQCGAILAPTQDIFFASPLSSTTTTAVGLVTVQQIVGGYCNFEVNSVNYNNAYLAYLYVNTLRYLTFEACGKMDQVQGWYIDTTTGQLQLFQQLIELNLNPSINRGDLIDQTSDDLNSTERAQLHNLNALYKLSIKAIEKVSGNPKTEGNIVEVCDKCGNRWLVAVNRATNSDSVCNYTGQYVIVSILLC